jgi:hypothetical protein
MKEGKDSEAATLLAALDTLVVEAEQTAAALEQHETNTDVFMIDLAQLVQTLLARVESAGENQTDK